MWGKSSPPKLWGKSSPRGRGGKGEQQFPGKHRLPGENLFERKLNRGNRMLKKRR